MHASAPALVILALDLGLAMHTFGQLQPVLQLVEFWLPGRRALSLLLLETQVLAMHREVVAVAQGSN